MDHLVASHDQIEPVPVIADGTSEIVPGGVAYRFALKVDCGKSFVADAKLTFAKDLVALFEEEFGRTFYEVGAKY